MVRTNCLLPFHVKWSLRMLVNEHTNMTLLQSLQILFRNATYKFFDIGNQMHPQDNHSKHSFPVTPYMLYYQHCMTQFTSHSPWQNDRHFQDDIFGCIFREWKVLCFDKILLRFVFNSPIGNNPALVHIMSWRRNSDRPLSETMLTWFTDAYIWH